MEDNRQLRSTWSHMDSGTLPNGWDTTEVQQSVANSYNSHAMAEEPDLELLTKKFKDIVDPEVIEMIWEESNGSGSLALKNLASICGDVSKPQVPSTVVSTSWSEVLSRNNSEPFIMPQIQASVRPKQPAQGFVDSRVILADRTQKGEKILVLMRGVSGSGKSTLAHKIKGGGIVLSTDDYFINNRGEYLYNPALISSAHNWNQTRAEQEIKSGRNPVIIDNTNLESWEMQPYICMAIRFNYSVEVLEPDTPWKYDIQVLVRKTSHQVPKDKIRLMLEKVKVPVDVNFLVEECRRKWFRNHPNETQRLVPVTLAQEAPPSDLIMSNLVSEPEPTCQTFVPSTPAPVAVEAKPQRASDRWNQRKDLTALGTSHKSSGDLLFTWEKATPWEEQETSGAVALPPQPARNQWPSRSSFSEDEATSSNEVGIQTSNSDSNFVKTLETRSRDINPTTDPGTPKKVKKKTTLTLDKGCLTEGVTEESGSRRRNLAVLQSHFPATDAQDLADMLDKCQGDLDWASNLLLDSGYQWAAGDGGAADFIETVDGEEEATPDEADVVQEEMRSTHSNDEALSTVSSSETGLSTETQDDPETLRKYIQDRFVLTDTISDQARRICGKDYNQFRASQLQRSRHDLAVLQLQESSGACAAMSVTSSEESTRLMIDSPLPSSSSSSTEESEGNKMEDEGAMIPFVMDTTFAQHLSALFGDPNIGSRHQQQQQSQLNQNAKNSISFDIPWTLAEQIYLHWISSLVDQHEDQAQGPSSEMDADQDQDLLNAVQDINSEDVELRNIMDFEMAMRLAQQEKKAERRKMRDHMSTKLSMQKLHEEYPHVDPLALDALFEENDYNYDHTVAILDTSLGNRKLAAKSKASDQAVRPQPPRPAPEVPAAAAAAAAIQKNESGRDLRSEAFMYNRLRQEFQNKAQESHRRGMSAVATYYASESRRYADLYKEANQKAALQIVEEKNVNRDERTIDLHELKVAEALAYLESFIVENLREGRTVIQVITGKGNHSVNGKPRIKPAVATFLNKKKYGFEEVNAGCLRVYLRRSISHR